ncbi:MAG: sigma-70 family RNA polymerase sigma factor [Verrucomicrobiota bacterium]
MSDVTRILNAADRDDAVAAGQLLPLVYQELRRLAAHRIAQEAPGNTLQPTALVHEAWLRLLKPGELAKFQNENHFVATAAEAMRRILVESARRKKRIKHGGALERVDLDEIEVALPLPEDEVIALDEALDRLAKVDPRSAEVVQLRFFVGLTQEEVARELGMSLRTVERLWKFARAWLFRELKNTLGTGEES